MEQPLKVLVVEDELITADDIDRSLRKAGYTVLGPAGSYPEAVAILAEQEPDIALLDIQIPGGKDGVELAAEINDSLDIPIIFITSHSDASTLARVKTVVPDGYLVKPFNTGDLHISIEIAITARAARQKGQSTDAQAGQNVILKDYIFIREEHRFMRLSLSEIQWMKGAQNYTEFHTADKMHLVRGLLKDMVEGLPKDRFFRIHRSYVINLDHLTAIDTQTVRIGEHELPLSKSFRTDLLDNLPTLQ